MVGEAWKTAVGAPGRRVHFLIFPETTSVAIATLVGAVADEEYGFKFDHLRSKSHPGNAEAVLASPAGMGLDSWSQAALVVIRRECLCDEGTFYTVSPTDLLVVDAALVGGSPETTRHWSEVERRMLRAHSGGSALKPWVPEAGEGGE